MAKGITRERIERVARIYNTNQDAARALGIAAHSLGRLCRKWNIQTPSTRRRAPRKV